MKKILYIVTSPHFGGAQKYVSDLATSLAKNADFSVEVAVGAGKKSEWLTRLEKNDITVHYLTHVRRELSLYHDPLSIGELYRLYQKVKPDIIHLNSSKIGATGALAAAYYKKSINKPIKVIYTVHGFVLNEQLALWREIYYWKAEWLGAKLKDHIICVSEYDKQSLLKWHIVKPNKISVIHNGINTDNFYLSKIEAIKKLTTKYQLPDTKYYVGAIANLYVTKNLGTLINAADLLNKKNPDITYLVIGNGPERKNLTRQIAKLGLTEKFYLLGNIDDAQNYLKAFDVFTLPSQKEGLPYTILEAIAAGLPIVASNVGGIPEALFTYYTKEQYVLIDPGNFVELTQSIESHLDTPLLSEDKLRDIRKKIDIKIMTDKTSEIYS